MTYSRAVTSSFNANNTMNGSFNCQLLEFDVAWPGKINFRQEEESQNGFFSKETSPWTPPSIWAAPVLTCSKRRVWGNCTIIRLISTCERLQTDQTITHFNKASTTNNGILWSNFHLVKGLACKWYIQQGTQMLNSGVQLIYQTDPSTFRNLIYVSKDIKSHISLRVHLYLELSLIAIAIQQQCWNYSNNPYQLRIRQVYFTNHISLCNGNIYNKRSLTK